ncbi:MAG TPA: hypothetical protein VFE27_00880 [Acidobacteriaceae bacterium]|nr:hypothetical protein [Acidobacteriaceae bacterium]
MRQMAHFQSFPGRFWAWTAATTLFLGAGAVSLGQALSPTGNHATDPQKIVRDASWNELHATKPGRSFTYRQHTVDPKGSTVKQIVETKDGDVARLIEKNGKPLPPNEAQAELDRLNNLLAHPEVQEHRHKKEQEDSARGDEMVRMLPDAFLFTLDGMVEGPNGPCYRLKFRPNPAFTPPDREGEVYHGMVGELWVDQAQLRLVKIDAHLISDVNFGWGVLGRLYKGGSILVQNADVGLHHWETIHMKLQLQGKLLMMKSVDYSTTENFSDFQVQPQELGYQEAIRLLQRLPATAQVASR